MSSALEYKLSDIKIPFKKRNVNTLDDDRHLFLFSCFTTFLSSCLGTGILFMPYVFDHSGVSQATLLLILIAFLTYQSDYALFKVAKKLGSKNLKEVIYKTFESQFLSYLIPLMTLFQLMCSSICYMIIIQNSISKTMYYINKNFNVRMQSFLCLLIRRPRFCILGDFYQLIRSFVHLFSTSKTLLHRNTDFMYCSFSFNHRFHNIRRFFSKSR